MGSNADRRTDLSPAASRVPQSPLSAAPVAASLISAAQEAPLLPGMVSYSFSAHTLALRELCGDTAAVLGCDEHSLFRGDALLLEHVVSSSLFEATEVLESLLADTDARVYSYPWRRADSGEILYISNHVVAEGEGASRTISGVLLHETTREHRLSNRARILHNDLRPSAPNSPRGDELLYRAHLPLAWKLPEDADLKLHLR
ncbi:hypothetical protein MRY87_09845, partial [bacterium]|nr:hypothetical protein [bacterium]